MTASVHAATPATSDGEAITTGLWAEITPEFLASVEWSTETHTLKYRPDHPVLGWRECVIPECDQKIITLDNLCAACNLRWKQQDRPDLAEFVKVPRVRLRRIGVDPCTVRVCGRTAHAASGLCGAHERRRKTLRLSNDDFLALPKLEGHAPFDVCSVLACGRQRGSSTDPYCVAHATRWRDRRDPTGTTGDDEGYFRRTQPAISLLGEACLAALPDRVLAELLYGLQQNVAAGARLDVSHYRMLANNLRSQEVIMIEEADPANFTFEVAQLHRKFVKWVRRLRTTPDLEVTKDVWDLVVFGFSGTLKFAEISQPWLRAAAKIEVANDLPRRRGKGGKSQCQSRINFLALLSDSLRMQRDDDGVDPRALARKDITAFLNRLAYLEAEGALTNHRRIGAVRELRRTLNQMRALGLTRPGEPLHGLPDDFTLAEGDIPDQAEEQQAGRDLPVEVIRYLCEHLDELEAQAGTEVRVAVELMIDTGRRPEEICALAWDCLSRDGDGKPVLVYDNLKANRLQRRLPIATATAAVIERQQRRARQRFPATASQDLKLLPTSIKNPYGAKGLRDETVGARHRKWVESLPDVMVSSAPAIDGKAAEPRPFDKARMFPYAYRHTYAQRHADAGVPVDVLRELMDHMHLVTTQGYYRIGEDRRRQAVDRVTAMQFDRHGNRTWRTVKALLDSEHLRRAVGEVAVPYGTCSEPSNVAAGGEDCPVRFRCVGCAHFNTDVSYLPDLEGYLADLLRTREKLLSFVDADEWARSDALPSDEEIRRIRRLIARIKEEVNELSDAERAQVEEAIGVVRRARNGVARLNMPSIRKAALDVRPDRTAQR